MHNVFDVVHRHCATVLTGQLETDVHEEDGVPIRLEVLVVGIANLHKRRAQPREYRERQNHGPPPTYFAISPNHSFAHFLASTAVVTMKRLSPRSSFLSLLLGTSL